jgi:DNA-binding MarR family transcriptional regulator
MSPSSPLPPQGSRQELIAAGRMVARLARTIESSCLSAGLSFPQFRVLLFADREPQRAGELASRSDVSRPTLTAIVNALEEQGLMYRERVDGDRRGIRLLLTDDGRRRLSEAEGAVADRLGQLAAESGVPALATMLAAVGPTLDREFEERMRQENGVPSQPTT